MLSKIKKNTAVKVLAISIVYAAAFLTFLYNIAFLQGFGTSVYSQITQAISMAAFAQVFVNFGADRRLVKDITEAKGFEDTFIWTATLVRCVLFCVTMSLFFVFGMDASFLFFFGWYVLNSLYPRAASEFKERILQQNTITLIERVWCLILILGATFVDQIAVSFFQLSIALFISRLGFISLHHCMIARRPTLSMKNWLEALRLQSSILIPSFWIMLAFLINATMIYGQHLHLSRYATDIIIGTVGFAIQLSAFVMIMQGQLIRFFNKDLFQSSNIDAFARLRSRALGIFLPTLVMVVFMSGLSFVLEKFIFPDKFQDLFVVSLILSLWLCVLSVGLVSSQMMIKVATPYQFLGVAVFGATLSIVLSLWLVPVYLGVGFALQLLIAHGCAIALQFFVLSRISAGSPEGP